MGRLSCALSLRPWDSLSPLCISLPLLFANHIFVSRAKSCLRLALYGELLRYAFSKCLSCPIIQTCGRTFDDPMSRMGEGKALDNLLDGIGVTACFPSKKAMTLPHLLLSKRMR